jgi:polar amino acid transport system substrate-binding protein
VAVLVLLTAGCAGPATEATPPLEAVRLDQSLHDRLPQEVRDAGVLRVGTDASYAPMSSFDADGRTIVGMEPDLGARLGRVLGVRIEFVNADFTRLLPMVVAGDLDLGMSAITDTPERSETVDFVDYFTAGTAIVVQRGNPARVRGIRDLCGQAVAVEAGTVQVDLLARAQADCAGDAIEVRTYPTNPDALLQLRTGRAVAVLNDLPPAVFLATDPRTSSNFELASKRQYEPAPYGIAVAQDRPELRDAVAAALRRLMESGAYRDVLDTWGVRSGAVPRITVTSGH